MKIQRAEEISLEALNYGAGQTLANLEIKPVDSSFEQYEKQVNTLVAAMSRKEIKKAVLSPHRHIEPSGSFRWAAVFSTGCKIRFGFCFVGQCARCRKMDRSYARNIARL